MIAKKLQWKPNTKISYFIIIKKKYIKNRKFNQLRKKVIIPSHIITVGGSGFGKTAFQAKIIVDIYKNRFSKDSSIDLTNLVIDGNINFPMIDVMDFSINGVSSDSEFIKRFKNPKSIKFENIATKTFSDEILESK